METYQDYEPVFKENAMMDLLPFERQILLAEIYHYAWYNDEAYQDLLAYLEKYRQIAQRPNFLTPKTNNNDSKNTNP